MESTTTKSTKNTSMKKVLIAAMLLVLAVVFWKWTMVQRYGDYGVMRYQDRMQKQAPMSDDQLKQDVDASATADAEADLKVIDAEF